MGITDNNKIFTLADMKAAFEAGELRGVSFDLPSMFLSDDDVDKVKREPDFNEFMDKKYFITVENK